MPTHIYIYVHTHSDMQKKDLRLFSFPFFQSCQDQAVLHTSTPQRTCGRGQGSVLCILLLLFLSVRGQYYKCYQMNLLKH